LTSSEFLAGGWRGASARAPRENWRCNSGGI